MGGKRKTVIEKTRKALLARAGQLQQMAEALHAKEAAHTRAEQIHQRVRESKRRSGLLSANAGLVPQPRAPDRNRPGQWCRKSLWQPLSS